MGSQTEKQRVAPPQPPEGITRIAVSGFKSILDERSVEIGGLTILAGANGSGKSSIMQPLLLLKQTLEATYDPGPLLLSGPNVRFSSADELLAYDRKGGRAEAFSVGVCVDTPIRVTCRFRRQRTGLKLEKMGFSLDAHRGTLQEGMSSSEIRDLLRAVDPAFSRTLDDVRERPGKSGELLVTRTRCFFAAETRQGLPFHFRFAPSEKLERQLRRLIHVPGLRGNPERTYPVSAVGESFPGTFENYVASVIAQWQSDRQKDKQEALEADLSRLGLTWKVSAYRINDTQVELHVGRLTRAAMGRTSDVVNVADAGFGVSQSLPVLVALQASQPGQLVYLEQPEIHLHPRAQFALAEILANAARRGVRVVAETHSSLLLLGVQALVAEGKMSPEMVKLHWFQRGNDGVTKITSAGLDEAGAFGGWPEDFGDVALTSESRYLDAAELRLKK